MVQILIAFPAGSMSEKIRLLLSRRGYDQAIIISGGGEALRTMGELHTGILICPVKLRDMDYTEVLMNMSESWRMVLIDSKQNVSSRREDDVISIGLPVPGTEILSTVEMVFDELDRMERLERKRKRSIPKKRSPEEQKIIDEAKALIMNRNRFTEEEAFRYIQKNSMDTGRSMIETAEMILTFG